MAKEALSQDLADFLVTKNFDPEYFDAQGQPAEAGDAKTMKFDYVAGTGKNYGTAVCIIGDDELSFFYGDNLGRGMEPEDKDEYFEFLEQLSNQATSHSVMWRPTEINKLKHSLAGQAAIKEGLFEGYYGNRKVSYMGEQTQARLVINHNRTLGEDDKRYRYVESLYIETADQERFRLPFKSLAAGRAMLEHVRQGGRPYDVRGTHITEIVSEMAVLSRFNRAQHNRVFEGVTQELVESAEQYYRNLQETIKHLGSTRGYQAYFESWAPDHVGEAESLVENLRNMFVEQTLDARIEAALPTLAKIQQQGMNMKEAQIFENWINNLSEGTWALPETPEQQEKINKLMSAELIVGPDATNATELLYDIVGDDELFDILNDLADRSEGRANIWDDSDVQRRLAELGIQTPQSTAAEPADVEQDTAPPVAEDFSAPPQDTTGHGDHVRQTSGGNRNVYRLSQLLRDPSVESYLKIEVPHVSTPSKELIQGIKSKKWEGVDGGRSSIDGPGGWFLTAKNPMYFKEFLQALSQSVSGDKQIRVGIDPYVKNARAQQGMAEASDQSNAISQEQLNQMYANAKPMMFIKNTPVALVPLAKINQIGTPQQVQQVQQALGSVDQTSYTDEYKNKGYVVFQWNGTALDLYVASPEVVSQKYVKFSGQLPQDEKSRGKIPSLVALSKLGIDPSKVPFFVKKVPNEMVSAKQLGLEGKTIQVFWGSDPSTQEVAPGGFLTKNEHGMIYTIAPDAQGLPIGYLPAQQGVAEGDNMATFVEDRELSTMLKYAGVPIKEGVLNDDTRNTWDHLLDRFPHEVKQFKQSSNLDDELYDDLYDALYDYYSQHGAMPYRVQKAKDGSARQWVGTQFRKDCGLDENLISSMIMPVSEGSCNMTMEGEYCPEHGLMECGSMYEDGGAVGMPYSMGEDVDEAMFPGSAIGDKLRAAKDSIGRGAGEALKGAMIAAPGAGAGASAGAAMSAGASSALFAPALGAGALGGAAAALGGFLTYKGLNWLAQKLFGTKEEALQFANAHLKAASSGQPQFEFQGKTYPVKIKSPQEAQQLIGKIRDLQSQLGEDHVFDKPKHDDAINSNSAMTGSYYEGKETKTQEGDALLARIKSLALLR